MNPVKDFLSGAIPPSVLTYERSSPYHSYMESLRGAFISRLIQNGSTIGWRALEVKTPSWQEVSDWLEDFGFQAFLISKGVSNKALQNLVLYDQDSLIQLSYSPKYHILSVNITGSEEKVDHLFHQIQSRYKQSEPDPTIWCLINTPQGVTFREVGSPKGKLEPDNYSSSVLKGYEHFLSCLDSENPCGRIALFQGPPGTGKTFLLRALAGVATREDRKVVYIPSNMVGNLSGPSLIQAFLQAEAKRFVLIVEDGDAMLLKRTEGGQLGSLSEILNLGDGLLGQLLDIRVVITTNSDASRFDSAITRPGRLCSYIKFDKLTPEQGCSVFARLTGSEGSYRHPVSLAQVYQDARAEKTPSPFIKEEVKSGDYL